MRIGQLARHLGISPSDILGFLSDNNIEAEAGTNSRLSQETVLLVTRHFAPDKVSVPGPMVEPVEEVAEEPVPTESEIPVDETPPEVIRVAKVELQGLKVLGKIDLPQPKKKTEEQEPAPERAPRKEFQKTDSRRDRQWKNPLEQKRMQEAREAERKKKEKAEREKERRTSHYYSKVRSVPTKAVRKVEEQTVVEEIDTKEPPKTIFGKFLRWLTT